MIPTRSLRGVDYGVVTLGTVQMGLAYGIGNRDGMPSDATSERILRVARAGGVTMLDTARAYGQSEARIGRFNEGPDRFRICTKLALDGLAPDAAERSVSAEVDRSIEASLRDLRTGTLDIVLFHSMDGYVGCNGAAVRRLETLVRDGVVGEIGVSVYTPEEAAVCLDDRRIRHLQVPFNILDRRWIASFAEAVRKRGDVAVHARSVFLQGLLVNQSDVWPAWCRDRAAIVERIGDLVAQFGRRNAADLCMAYVKAFPWITSLVIGCETDRQLVEILDLASRPELERDQIEALHAALPAAELRLLNPSLW